MLLTIFTPSYNRADLLPRGYEALLRQTSHDFCWIIIDDGSKDNTRELIRSWFDPATKKEDGDHIIGVSKDAPWLHMHYCYKENGGLHTGYNKAIELMDTEICVCIDSDDYMPDDAVELIVDFWNKNRSEDLSGFIGLDYYINGGPIGGPIEEVTTPIHFSEINSKLKHKGDTKIVMRVDLLKNVAPQPTFPGEKNFNPIYMIWKLDRMHPFLTINKNLCFVDYQEGGMTYNIFRQYTSSPNSFAALRLVAMNQPKISLTRYLMENLHYVSDKILAGKTTEVFKEGTNKLLMCLLLIPGWLLTLFIKYKAKR